MKPTPLCVRRRSGAGKDARFEERRFAEARKVYRDLLAEDRSQRELQFGIAVLSVQLKDWETAEAEQRRSGSRAAYRGPEARGSGRAGHRERGNRERVLLGS